MKKKILLFLIVFSLVSGVAFAHPKVTITLNDNEVKTDVPPVIKNDRVFVPVRFISEALGYQVTWDEVARQVKITKPGTETLLTVDKKEALVKGKNTTLDVAPFIAKDRTMVPLRFIAESMDVKVDWDPKNYVVILTQKSSATSLLDGLDLSRLTPAELAYVKAFDETQMEITSYLSEFRSYAFENFDKYSKAELIQIFRDLSFKINAAAGKAKDLQAPERFKDIQELYKRIAESLPGMMENYKEAFLGGNNKAAGALVYKLNDLGAYTHQVVESMKAELKGEKYTPSKELQEFNKSRENNSMEDEIFKNLFDQL
ncbi:MAG: copper amine oxidase N-terminal domain-containing protein [Tissierellia bacterium]|nr:copper amine oxidase N-terminal domain-containing protein [Tissierellia bacterium]